MKDKEINKKVINLISEILNLENLSNDASQENTEQWDERGTQCHVRSGRRKPRVLAE